MTLGNLTPGSPMTIDFNAAANGDVILHFVLSETDDKCLAYDAATADSAGKKTGTYEFDMTHYNNLLNRIDDSKKDIKMVIKDDDISNSYQDYMKKSA